MINARELAIAYLKQALSQTSYDRYETLRSQLITDLGYDEFRTIQREANSQLIYERENNV